MTVWPPGLQVRDSSGVELVWSGPAVYEGDDAWRVASEPVLQIGEVDGEEPYLFERPGDAVRAPIPRIPVNDEVRAARRAQLEEWISDARLPAGEGAEIDARLPVPDSLPAIRNMLWDRKGNLWVGRREVDPLEAKDFDVFDPSGRWISTVHFPRDMGYFAEIGEDYILARWYDDLGVPYLRVFDLEMPRK